jgi:hypothetical protein
MDASVPSPELISRSAGMRSGIINSGSRRHATVVLTVLACSAVLWGCNDLQPTEPAADRPIPAGPSAQLAGSIGYYGRTLPPAFRASVSGQSVGILSDIALARTVFRTDYVTAGVGGLRDVGSGSISLSGVTGPVTLATLYWHSVANTTDPEAGGTVAVNGTTVTGLHLGFSSDNCWGYNNSQAWAADVTSLVQAAGDGVYVLDGFGGFPTVNPNGASLVVFYDDGDPSNDRDAVVYEGNDSNMPNPFDADGWNVTLAGIVYTGGTARLELHVADGQQYIDDALILNGVELEPRSIIFGGMSVPGANDGPFDLGRLWDIRSWDVTAWLSPGENTLELTTGMADDCLALVVAIVDLPAGAAPDQPPADNTAPVLAPIGDHTVDEGSTLAFVATAMDADGDPLTFSLSGAPAGAAIDPATGAFTWTPVDGPATATFRVVVSDGTLTDDEEITVTVHNVAPAVQAGADATIAAGSTLALSAAFSDPGVNDQPWTWLVAWGDGTTSGGTATSQAVPIAITSGVYAAAGVYTVTVTVTDKDGGEGSSSLTLTVTPAQPAPTATAACSPGFWGQNGVRRDVWPAGYATSDLVSAVFTQAAGYLGGATLLEALHGYREVRGRRNTVEGAGEILLRAAVAAVLNEASFGAAYPAAGVPAIAAAVNAALDSGDRSRILGLAEILDRWNNNLPADAGAYPGLAADGPVLPSGSCSLAG